MKQEKTYHMAFTLVELLIVITIITLLSGIIFIASNPARKKSRDAAALAELQLLVKPLEFAMDFNGKYPTLSIDSEKGELGGCLMHGPFCSSGKSSLLDYGSTPPYGCDMDFEPLDTLSDYDGKGLLSSNLIPDITANTKPVANHSYKYYSPCPSHPELSWGYACPGPDDGKKFLLFTDYEMSMPNTREVLCVGNKELAADCGIICVNK